MVPATASGSQNLKCLTPPESLLYCYIAFGVCDLRMPHLRPQKKTCARLKETKWTMVFPHSRYTTTTTLWVYIRRNCIEKPNQVSTLDPKNIVQWKCAVGGARWIEIMKVEGKVWLCATFFSPFISGTLRPRQSLFSGGELVLNGDCAPTANWIFHVEMQNESGSFFL